MAATLSTRRTPAPDLAQRTAVVIGVGGLGHPVISGLLAVGVRRWVLVDPDRVETSNLHRQWLFAPADRSRLKARVAADWILARAPHSEVQTITTKLAERGPLPWDAGEQDLWFECSDQPSLKFALSARALREDRPCIIGGVLGWQGQIFAQRPQPGCYRCLFEAMPQDESLPTCAGAGVLTTAPAFIGLWMVARARTILGHAPCPTSSAAAAGRVAQPNSLIHWDLRSGRSQTIIAPRRSNCPACGALARLDAVR